MRKRAGSRWARIAMLMGLAALVGPAAGEVAPEGAEAGHQDCMEGFLPWSEAPGRPEWAPLEVSWGERAWWGALRKVLREGSAQERARAAFGLGLSGCDPAREDLARALEEEAAEVRRFAGLALGYLGDQRGEAQCREALREGPPWQRYYALVGLWRLDSPETREYVGGALEGQDPFLEEMIPEALRSAPWRPAGALVEAEPAGGELGAEALWQELANSLSWASDYWWHTGKYDQVCRLLEAALFYDARRVDTFDSVAWLQWSLGRDERAIEALERGIAANAEEWLAHFNLGFHYFNTRRFEEALPHLKTAAELVEDRWLPLHMYAHGLERLGRKEEALQVWEHTRERFPDNPSGQANLERIRRELGIVPEM